MSTKETETISKASFQFVDHDSTVATPDQKIEFEGKIKTGLNELIARNLSEEEMAFLKGEITINVDTYLNGGNHYEAYALSKEGIVPEFSISYTKIWNQIDPQVGMTVFRWIAGKSSKYDDISLVINKDPIKTTDDVFLKVVVHDSNQKEFAMRVYIAGDRAGTVRFYDGNQMAKAVDVKEQFVELLPDVDMVKMENEAEAFDNAVRIIRQRIFN